MVKEHTKDKPDFYDDLEKTYEEIWKLLIIGKAKAKSEFHQGYLATYNNEFPSIRTVVLRHADKEKNSISFHTDFRSKKITELNNNNNVSMMFYDHGKKIQIKVSGKAEINHKNEKSENAWKNTRPFSKKCYIVDLPPGSNSNAPVSGYKKEHEESLPDTDILDRGYDNFSLIEIKIESIEWLYLHRHGHRRALFKIENKNKINQNWLTP